MSKKISVIVPCYMVEEYIDRCVKSLLNQTIGLDNLELIFINDASPDNTLSKLLEYEKQYPDNILVINSEENLKQGGAKNLGLNYASADYIGFVDSDDWIESTMYEKLYQKAVLYDCDIVSCELKRVKTEDTLMGRTGYQDRLYIIEDDLSRKDIIVTNMGSCVTKIFKRSLIFDNEIFFPEHLSYEDNYFAYLMTMYFKRIYYIGEYLYHYFVNPHSTVVKPNSAHHFDRLIVEIMKLEEFKKRSLYDHYHEEIEYNFLQLFYLNTLHIVFTRFSEVPVDLFPQMHATVLREFPNYKDNYYLNTLLSNTNKELLRTLDIPEKQIDWLKLAQNYRDNL